MTAAASRRVAVGAWRACALRLLLALVAGLACGIAQAEPRAWLDRDRIVLGESATLNIETDQAGVDAPDYAALRGDFRLSGHASRRSMERTNGRTVQRSHFAVALEPRRAGVVGIPAVQVGGTRTQPLALTVLPADAAGAPAQAGEPVFIETTVDDTAPYVQQAVGIVVRLHYAMPLVSGNLDMAAPAGATLRRVGDDLQYTRELAGQRYSVLERRYLLIPERSGTLALPGATFAGRGVGGFFDDLFGDGVGDALRARGRAPSLDVQPVPDGAPQPWRPLHDLRLRYVEAPRSARAGEAATVVVEAQVDGAGAASAPALELVVGAGAQVFAEPAQVDERMEAGRPRATVTRRFSVVPARAGPLRIEGPALGWWDVGGDVARTATLPAIELEIAPGDGAFAAPPAPGPVPPGGAPPEAGGAWVRVPGVQGEARPWAVVAVGFALLWLVTLAWALGRRSRPAGAARPDAAPGHPSPRPSSTAWRRALEAGDVDAAVDALHAMAPASTGGSLEALQRQLADAAQREALSGVEAARWGQGSRAAARDALRDAFRKGPSWVVPVSGAPRRGDLPPLYPER